MAVGFEWRAPALNAAGARLCRLDQPQRHRYAL
jgi:hypothetical protein